MRIGMVGCGNISRQYLEHLPALPDVELVAVADIDRGRAAAVAAGHPGLRALTVDELLTDPQVDTVLNLTVPAAHAQIDLAAIAAGKHVYAEKPFAVQTAEGQLVLAAADAAGVVVGSAPDTVLGTGIQTARAALDEGLIGAPTAATATMVTPGHERWHPNPDFYYLHALVTLLGPVSAVIGAGSRSRDTREIGKGDRAGVSIPVEIDTHVTGVLIHESGVLSTLVMSFDAAWTSAHPIEVHGTTGTLAVPDPNVFDGEASVRGLGDPDWRILPPSAGFVDVGRGIGLQDMACRGTDLRASGALGLHALDVMNALLASAESGTRQDITTACTRPEAVPLTRL
jgi:predicted dehydrogenase